MPGTPSVRGFVVALSLALAGGAYVAAPYAAAASHPGVVRGQVPTVSTALNGSVVVGPGGASTGYYTRISVMTHGGSLRLVNLDELAHTVTSVARKPNGEPLFNGNALPGTTAPVIGVSTLPPGTYDFYCQFHPNMTGQLIVLGKRGKPVHVKPHFPGALRIPKVLTGSHITIPVTQRNVRMLPTGPKTSMWTYGGSFPGPTIRRPAGHKTTVTFINMLSQSVGSISVHLHGDHHSSASDGRPDSHLIKSGRRHTYTYPLTDGGKPEPEAFEFYHDHRMNETDRNNWNGLQGMFILTHKGERKLGLPNGRYDVPLDVTDRSFDNLNQLTEPFPAPGVPPKLTDKVLGQFAPPGDATVGNDILVNGKLTPHFDVRAHRYRLQILNSSSFQSYDFALTKGMSFKQIGSGDGLLPSPVVRHDILLGPSERADVVVDFRHQIHRNVVLRSIPRTNNVLGGIGTLSAPIMQFRVGAKTADHSRVPKRLPSARAISAPSSPSELWTFGLGGDLQRGTYWTVNGHPYDPKRIDATVPLGSTQTWELINLSTITHYIHIHEEQWHTILRDGKPPPAYERGLVDTWRLDPGESVEVAAKFTDYTGVFMIHCHMLDHEDHGMMAQFAVVKPGNRSLPAGYFRGSGPAMPAALAKLPYDDALATSAMSTQTVSRAELAASLSAMHMPMEGMGIGGMDLSGPTRGVAAVLERSARAIAIVLPLVVLFLFLTRGRVRTSRGMS